MALNFKKALVDHEVVTCEVATHPKATNEVIDDMMGKVVTVSKIGVTLGRTKEPFAVFTLEEYPDFHFHAGSIFNKMVAAWMCDSGDGEFKPGNCDNLNAEITECGGLKMRFNKQPHTDSSRSDYWLPVLV